MALSKPISDMTDEEVLAEIRNLRERRAARAADLANKRALAAAATKLPKEKKEKLADDAITVMLRNLLADELKAKDNEPKKA